MEMESSRRPPFDRSINSLKKPRLTEDSTRQFQQQQRTAGNNNTTVPIQPPLTASSRFRTNEREREHGVGGGGGGGGDDPVRGALQQYQQHQELVNQYKTALAELTFNSKPIITNLTIIAGENLQAAKAIAASICSNILEVPREQKLPSLYLLDSIVKNIGRDYIKYFAARLPEVFCKAYRLVDPSTHPGMRHLFGTWKGVFPPQTLQIIEKELGFAAAVNGPSSGSATSKSDSQSQRPPHSIHVNPKYLEARQRLQQSNRPKGAAIGGLDVDNSEDVDRPERNSSAVTERPWVDPLTKLHNTQRPQREALREPNHQKQGGGGYGDYEFASGLSRPLSASVGKPSERLTGQGYDKRWLGRNREVEESLSSQRNGYDVKPGLSNYTAARLASGNSPSMQNAPSGAEISRSWKNSEEEEYMWDDLGTRVGDPGAISGTKKDIWSSDDLEKSGYNPQEVTSHLPKWQSQTEVRSSFEREPSADSISDQKEQAAFGHPRSSQWKMQEPHRIDSASPLLQNVGARPMTGASPAGVSSFGFPNTVSGSAVSVGQRLTSPGQSPMHQRPPSPSLSKRDPRQNLAERDHMRSHSLGRSDPRTASLSGQLNLGLRDQSSQNSMPSRHQNLQSGNVQKLLSQTLSKLSSAKLPSQGGHAVPSSEQLATDHSQASSLMADPSSKRLTPLATDSPGQSNVSGLLAAVMKSGLLSGNSVSGQLRVEPPATAQLTSQTTFTSSRGAITAPGLSHDSITAPFSQRKVEKPPLPPVPPPSSSNITAAPTSDVTSANSNPLSSLFSTLVAKGLISASKTESATPVPVKSESQVQEQSPAVGPVASTAPIVVPSVSKTSVAPHAPSIDKLSSFGPTAKEPDTSTQSTKVEIENPIGLEFRPRVLRELHPAVIDRLSENLPHKCTACGLHFKLEETLDRHLEWHAYKNSIPNCFNKPSRRWFSSSDEWIAGNAGFPFGYNSSSLTGESSNTGEEDQKMVPADESHCVCLLCGELFEDFYSQERDEWMFKGAVYMSIPSGINGRGPSGESSVRNLIVHANCMSDDSARDLGLISDIKLEKDA